MVEMQLMAVRVELPSNTPVVLLQENGGTSRTLPIFVGPPEATAIAYALQGVDTPRPMTHDLLRDVLAATEVSVTSVVITELRGATFYSEIHLLRDGHAYTVSSRPSDALALAARTGTPIYVDDELLDSEGVMIASDEDDGTVVTTTQQPYSPAEADEIVDEFRSFIDDIKPEDFGPEKP